jgi:hypothetical protein
MTAAPGSEDRPPQALAQGCAIWMRFENAGSSPAIEACEKLPGCLNFFLGDDASRWRTDVAVYAEIVYREVWPGIDLVFRLEDDAILRYSLRMAPNADASRVAFTYRGADAVVPDGDGACRITTPLGDLIDTRPGAGGDAGSVAFVDPGEGLGEESADTWEPGDGGRAIGFSTYLGSDATDNGKAITRCSDGAYIVTGETNTGAFPTTVGAYDRSDNGGMDIFVTKISSAGNALVWSTLLGGSSNDYAWGIAVDGNKYPTVVGSTASTDFPMTQYACFDRTYNGGPSDGFVTRLNATGSALLSSTYLGG